MGTQPRSGFVRVGIDPEAAFLSRLARPSRRRRRPEDSCPSGKTRHPTEAAAIAALIRVRKHRVKTNDPRPHESHLYACDRCDGWHLSSTPMLLARELIPERPQLPNEAQALYVRRLERRIAEQRSQILSLLATGNSASNRETRRRIAGLTAALARVTELWQQECRNREALVERLAAAERPRWWRR